MENLPWDIESCRHYGQLARKLFVLLTIWSDVIQVVKLLLYSSWLQFQRDSILCCELIQWLIHRTREAKHNFLLKSCIFQAVLVDGSRLFWCWSDVERIISFSRNCKNMGPNIPLQPGTRCLGTWWAAGTGTLTSRTSPSPVRYVPLSSLSGVMRRQTVESGDIPTQQHPLPWYCSEQYRDLY